MRERIHRRRLLLTVVGLLVMFALVATVAFVAGDVYALGAHRVREVTADQAAQAMQADEFYSDFRNDTLLVRGVVASEDSTATAATLEFRTQDTAIARCQLRQYVAGIHPGDTVTVVTVAAAAQRVSSGVLMVDCLVAEPASP